MKISIIRESTYKLLPWKNGLGMTKEIIISPETAVARESNFLWRLSTATLEGKESFSLFPGYMRTLAVVRGKELELSFSSGQSHETKILKNYHHVEFSGEISAVSDSRFGEVQDLNWICRRDIQSDFTMMNLTSKTTALRTGKTSIIYCIKGKFGLTGDKLTGDELRLGNVDQMIAEGDTLCLCDPEANLQLTRTDDETVFAHIRVY